jgi:hypothetical protein
MNRINIFVLILVLGVITGCSGKQQLGGKVTFSDNDEPLAKGAVFFTTPTFVAQGDLKQDGTYTVGSTGLDDGIPPGEYKIYIMGADDVTYEASKDGRGPQREIRKSLIDPKYQSAENSGLKFTVDGSSYTYDIQVDRAK